MIGQKTVAKPERVKISFQELFDKEKFPLWRKDLTSSLLALSSTIFFLTALTLIILYLPKLPPQIPLYFNKIGMDALADKYQIYFLPLGFSFFTLINFYLAHLYFRKDIILTKMLLVISLIFNTMLVFIVLRLLYTIGLIF